jgi:magnesium-transporting ATPase (P-type)
MITNTTIGVIFIFMPLYFSFALMMYLWLSNHYEESYKNDKENMKNYTMIFLLSIFWPITFLITIWFYYMVSWNGRK